jgi:hypothetical protein
MTFPVEAQLILADAAQAAGGKVSMLGAGWSITGSPTAPSAVVALIKVAWDRANEKIAMRLTLVDEDGRQVMVTGAPDAAEQPLELRAELEVGRPAGLKPGTPIDASFVAPMPPLPLRPGRYSWHLDIAGTDVVSSFQVVEEGPQHGMPG